jgi:hypothetical protein
MMRMKYGVSGLMAGLALLAFSAPAVQAQTTLGVRGGVSVSSASLDVSDTFDKSNRTGFVGGVFLDWGRSSLFGFQVGANYAQKGAELDLGDTVDNLNLAYLEIPAVLKVGIPLGIVKPSVFGGVALGFNTSCDEYVINGSDICDEFSSTEWSGVFGADAGFYLGSLSLWIDARYNVGLNDISGDFEFVDDLKNRAWNITGGVGFALGG